jgi:methyl-accepting chemotaxis protein
MSERRQSLKINQPFQARFLLEIVVLIFIFINVLLAVMLHLERPQSAGEFSVALALGLGLVEFAALAFFYWYLLRSSHRIAGPIYALQNRFQELRHGNLTATLKFRKKDYFHDTSEAFNECVTEMRTRIITLNRIAESLQEQTTEGTRVSELADQLALELRRFKTQ